MGVWECWSVVIKIARIPNSNFGYKINRYKQLVWLAIAYMCMYTR